ncbi:MAG: OmpA family protein [Paracoccaceae bacterium]|nr:MAG: OmpA family protein [Paracoccaceae bacterium]
MMLKSPILLAMAGTLALAGCIDPAVTGTTDNSRAQTGAITGALIGGAIGATRDGDNKLLKTAVGAGLGAIVGGAIGATLDRQAAELRGELGNNVQVINTGSELRVVMPQDILFATDSAALRPDLRNDLGTVARSLNRYPDSVVQVIGHTDNTGTAAYNYDLSQRRAGAVAAELRSNGVPGARIQAFGRGFDQPVASNATVEGRAQNRRVEIIIRPTA